ncbi:hypothetical protein F1D05_36055 [Kribbella qitaiheensis]|uniref:Uncharacterized protein n=1 Tax=Kribbella qitaiheensis TaxID=1544730 RepID=A0A7G6X7W3_9ACTN|nr:hypothetical protein [Kribbella qitaiheensis]QNE22328.1 hypothetical protein F1D05_36055 [Kribbella qitaiheensis]
MNGKRDKGPDNPWVRKVDPEDEGAASEPELPPSPWSLEVPPRPSPWTDTPGTPGATEPGVTGTPGWGTPSSPSAPGTAGTPGAGAPGSGGAHGSADPAGWGRKSAGDPGAGDTGVQGGPARETSSAWGDKVGPPSLRRPEPVKKAPKTPPLLIPVVAGIAVVALVAVALIVLTGGDDTADPKPSPSATVTTPPPSQYTPPANALPVAFGVTVVPVSGWSVLVRETQGKQLVTYAPNGEPRAFFWIRQKQNVTAKNYMLAIVEGETQNEVNEMGNPRNLACPRDVMVECIAISYTSTSKGVKVQGFVEAYQRKDGVTTAIDFRTRVDFAPKAEADAALMKASVVDSI